MAMLRGAAGNDTLQGLAEDDVLAGLDGNDILRGGAGRDTASYADALAGVVVRLTTTSAQDTGGAGEDSLSQIENLIGSAFADRLSGGTGDNQLDGGAGDDGLSGYWGDDVLLGGAGADTLHGGEGNDTINGGSGSDVASYALAPWRGVGVDLRITGVQDTGGAGWDLLIGVEHLRGSEYDDHLFGDDGANTLQGLAGDDRLYGNGGADLLVGGAGMNWLEGGDGDDRILGGLEQNNAYGGAGDDVIYGGEAWDLLSGGAGHDRLYGEGYLDVLIGGDGNDWLDGGALGDNMEGGLGDDTYVVDLYWDDVLEHADAGLDTVIASDRFTLPDNVENLILKIGALGQGNALANSLTGSREQDELRGLGGDDLLSGDWGDDILLGGAGADRLHGGSGNDTVDGGEGSDFANYVLATVGVQVDLSLSEPQDTRGAGWDLLIDIENLRGSSHGDELNGDEGANTLEGFSGDDALGGHDGADVLIGGLGADYMSGGLGDDTYYVDSELDYVSENEYGGNDTVRVSVDFALDYGVENLIVTSVGDLGSWGNALDNIMTGGSGRSYMRGQSGSDRLIGAAGDDVLEGDEGDDRLLGGADIDVLEGGDGDDELFGGEADDYLVGGEGADRLDGGAGSGGLRGGPGNDIYTIGSFHEVLEDYGGGTDTVILLERYLSDGNDMALPEYVENMTMLGEGQGFGNASANIMLGSAGWQYMQAGHGDDRLEGAAGADWLVGGGGADRFVYRFLGDSVPDDYDSIFDFSHAEGDRIDVSGIDADRTKAGNSAFTFIGSEAFTGKAGQLRVVQHTREQSEVGVVEADVDGDGVADVMIDVRSDLPLVAADFIL